MIYMILAISWWGVLLYFKNDELHAEQLRHAYATQQEYKIDSINEEHRRQSIMIVGEGLVLGLSLLAGIWIINRSAQKEIDSINNQNNFFLSVSHELKSPIAAIKLALQTALRPRVKEDMKKKLLQKATIDAERLEKMVTNVLFSANIDNKTFELYKEEIDLKPIIERIIARYQQNHEAEIIFDHDHYGVYHTFADVSGIELVISNLIENAIKYSDGQAEVHLYLSKDENTYHLDIKDHGIGIDKAERAKVLDRFYRGHNSAVRSRKGTGLGLYLADVIIRAHEGSLSISPNQDQGTIIHISLPIHE